MPLTQIEAAFQIAQERTGGRQDLRRGCIGEVGRDPDVGRVSADHRWALAGHARATRSRSRSNDYRPEALRL